jgi:hypothetical protein
VLVLENYVLLKEEQPAVSRIRAADYLEQYALD